MVGVKDDHRLERQAWQLRVMSMRLVVGTGFEASSSCTLYSDAYGWTAKHVRRAPIVCSGS